METPDSHRNRLLTARVFLGLAAAFMITLQFTSMVFFESPVRIYEIWQDIGAGLVWMLRGDLISLGS